MITNKPRPPQELIVGSQYNPALNVYDYFTTNEHGLDLFDLSTAGVFVSIVDLISVSGELQYLFVAADNGSGSSSTYGARVTIDGRVVFNNRLFSVSTATQAGIGIAGALFWNNTDDEPYCASSERLIFDQGIKIEAFISDLTTSDLVVAYRYRLTGLVGG